MQNKKIPSALRGATLRKPPRITPAVTKLTPKRIRFKVFAHTTPNRQVQDVRTHHT